MSEWDQIIKTIEGFTECPSVVAMKAVDDARLMRDIGAPLPDSVVCCNEEIAMEWNRPNETVIVSFDLRQGRNVTTIPRKEPHATQP